MIRPMKSVYLNLVIKLWQVRSRATDPPAVLTQFINNISIAIVS